MSSRLPDPSADERAHSDRLLTHLREEIAAHGAMPFSQYMERCLYAPGLGYYSAGKTKFGEAATSSPHRNWAACSRSAWSMPRIR